MTSMFHILTFSMHNQGIIRYSRGKITVLDRAALEGTACECYQVIEELYRRGLPSALSTLQPAAAQTSAKT